MSDSLAFRAFAHADLDLLFDWMNSATAFGPYDGLMFWQSREELATLLKNKKFATCRLILWNSEPVGWIDVNTDDVSDWIATLTVIIARPEFRGRGIGTQVHRELVREIWESRPEIDKIELWTDVENRPEQRVVEKLGFKLEGTFVRKFRVRGRYRDLNAYALLRPGL